MPHKYEPLSKKEKEAIINRHKEIVNEINSCLKEVDDTAPIKGIDLSKELDNPDVIASFRIAEEMKDIKEKQKNILEAQDINNEDKKWMVCLVKSENSVEATAYNRRLFDEYKKDPNRVKGLFFNKVMTFNPVKLMKLQDDKHKLLQFYRENHEMIDLAKALSNSENASFLEGLNPEFKKAIEEMSEPLSVIGYPAKLAEEATKPDFYALPELDQESAHWAIIGAERKNKEFSSSIIRDHLESIEGRDITNKPAAYFNAIKENSRIKINSDFLSSYVAQRREDNRIETMDFSDVIDDNRLDSYAYKRKESEALKIRCVNREGVDRYMKNWQSSFQKRCNNKEPFNSEKILENHKGNFMERYILKSTSKQYKNWEKAFEDYNNPESKDYMNADRLRDRTNAYLYHKFKTEEPDLTKLKGTPLKRAKLMLNTLATLNERQSLEMESQREIAKVYPTDDKSFLVEKDVEEIAPDRIKNGPQENDYVHEDEIEFHRIEL